MHPVKILGLSIDSLLKNEEEFTEFVDVLLKEANKKNELKANFGVAENWKLEELEAALKSVCLRKGMSVIPTKEMIKEAYNKLNLGKLATIDKQEFTNFWRQSFEKRKSELANIVFSHPILA